MTSRTSHDTTREQRLNPESRSSTPANSVRDDASVGATSKIDVKEDRGHGDPLNLVDARGALVPDPGEEDLFQVEDNKFAFSPGQLRKLFNPKSLGALVALGGLAGLEKGLRTDRANGLSMDEHNLDGYVSFEEATDPKARNKGLPRNPETVASADVPDSTDAFYDRRRVFRDNRVPQRGTPKVLKLIWKQFDYRYLGTFLCLVVLVSLTLNLTIRKTKDKSDGLTWEQATVVIAFWCLYLLLGGIVEWNSQKRQKTLERMVCYT